MRLVLDASAAIKLYVDEGDTPSVLRWLGDATEIVAPDIFLVEVVQALLRHRREGRLSTQDLNEAVAELRRNVEMPVRSAELIARALDLADLLNHGLHDCMYLALAERSGCPCLMADARLARKVSMSSLPIALRHHLELSP